MNFIECIQHDMILVNEPLANKAFSGIEEVEDIVFNRCRQLLNQQDLIRGANLLPLVA